MAEAQTGTRNSTYDLVSVLYHSLQGVETLETYRQDASGDAEIDSFLKDAQAQQRQVADRAKKLLASRLG